jgi:tetratricopeptide (TPR) repeat protein
VIVRVVIGSVVAATLFLLPLGANAQAITIFGPDPDARKCFESAKNAAEFGATTPYSRVSCTTALETGKLRTKDRAATHVNRGILSMNLQEYSSAIGDFDAARELYPRYGAIYVNRGNVFFIRDRFPSAIAEYTQALEAEMDEYQVAYLNRGMAHEMLGQFDAAEADYRQALALAPEWGLAISKLARVLGKQH